MKITDYDYVIYSDGGVAADGTAAAATIVEIKKRNDILNTDLRKRKIVHYLGNRGISAMEAEIFAGIVGLGLINSIEKNASRMAELNNMKMERPRVLWCCDNKVVVDSAETFVKKWKSNDWKNAGNKRVAYIKLWKEFLKLSKKMDLDTRYVKSHSGNKQNEACDKACRWVQKKGMGATKDAGENGVGVWLLIDSSS